jgi:hypothetical protein
MTTIETRGRNVLAELDQRVPTSFYWSLTVLATIGGFLFGYDTANIGSAQNHSVEEITEIFEKEAAGTGRDASGPLTRGAEAA